nr:uncharacterized protein LOC112721678 [Arachis hypogaea]
MKEGAKASIILGRPFLATAGAVINVQKGELTLRLHNKTMMINVFKAMNYPQEPLGECMRLDSLEDVVQETFEEEELEELTEEEESASSEEAATAEVQSAPIISPPDWNLPFELMCDASDFAIGAVLGQRKDNLVHVIYYASKEFNIEIKDKKGVENKVADHLSRIPHDKGGTHDTNVNEFFPDEQLMTIHRAPWFVDITNFKATGALHPDINKHQKRKLINDAKYFVWDEPYLFKKCSDGILRRCISEEEGREVLWNCHSSCYGVDYVSKWVEAIAAPTNDNKVVMNFLRKNIFSRFGVPRALISDGGSHFCNRPLEALLLRYGVKHKIFTPYHPQTSGAPSSKEARKDAEAMEDDNKWIAGRHHQKVVLLLDSICLEIINLEV